MAGLHLHYAARLAAVALLARGDHAAAYVALLQEREVALRQLRASILESRRHAVLAAGGSARQRRAREIPERTGYPAQTPTRSNRRLDPQRGYPNP